MTEQAATLVRGIEQLIVLPSVYFKLRHIIDSPGSSTAQIAEIISADAALAAKLLRLVNSPYYAPSRPVETISRAVGMLGTTQIHDLALACSLSTSLAEIRPPLMDVEGFWCDSLLRAVCARELSPDCGFLDHERLFVLGLLSDIGHMVMFMRIPEVMAQILSGSKGDHEPICLRERRRLGCDYAEVGSALLRRWGLPDGIARPIEQHADPQAQQPYAVETAILHLVDAAVRYGPGEHIERLTSSAAWHLTGQSPDDLNEVLAAGRASAAVVASIFGLNGRLL